MNPEKYKHLFIIGAAKSGTTYLYDSLINHPKLVGADPNNKIRNKSGNFKEPNLLLQNDITREKYIAAFEGNLRQKPSANILVDASTSYTKRPYKYITESDIKKISNNYLCIYLLRDPIDRFESHINFKYALRKNMIENDLNRICTSKGGDFALDIGNYAMQLAGFRNTFEEGKLLIIDFNVFIKNPQKILKLICKKIEIEFDVLQQVYPKEISNKTLDNVKGRIFEKFPLLNKLLYKLIPEGETRRILAKVYRKIIKSPSLPKRYLTDSEKYNLAQLYKPSLITLKEKFGINYFQTSWTTIKKYL